MQANQEPGALRPEDITAGLETRTVGRAVHSYRLISSTMDAARDAARAGAPEGLAVVADEQTAGRGRLQRHWVAPPGSSLLVTILLRPTIAAAQRLTMAASLAVAEAIEETTGLSAQIKWPNDVLIGGKKVCGILIETETDGGALSHCLVGIGVNVNFDPANLTDVIYPPTTLSHELGREVDRLPLLRALLRHLDRLLDAGASGAPVHEWWRARLATVGQRVRATMGTEVEEGVAEGVGPDGELLLRRDDGTLATILAGDVTLRM